MEVFVRRPVLSLVISLIILLLGVLALFQLPITQFPDIVPPSVVVTAKYNGANAEVCTKAVATPLERAINGVPGMTSMSSVSSNNGITLIQVYFKVGTDPDVAAVNVQNRVMTVIDELPQEVIKAGVTTEKEVNSMLLFLNLFSEDDQADEEFIYNFADINVLQELKRIEGVGFAEIMGQREYSMRVWLKPDRMLAYKIGTDEILEALRKQNVEAAPGKTGESSGRMSQDLQYVLRYTGKMNLPGQYQEVVLRAQPDGSLLKLKDVADIEFGTMSYGMVSQTDGKPSASIMIKQRPGSNARDVIKNIKAKMEELKKEQFPPGMTYNYAYDVSRFLDASISKVIATLIEAFILVFIVIFLFLQDWRSTLIPALAVPVALIGTLAFMLAMGFSINLLTLFALVLAIGIVVDDAIVVVEAVHVKMTEQHMKPLEATVAAMKEISAAIVAITLVMSAVFIPVAFLDGPVGVFYRQFSLTLAVSIGISGINALTLTPALCALIMKSHHAVPSQKPGLLTRFFRGFNKRYDQTEQRYGGLVARTAGRRMLIVGMLVVFSAAAGLMGSWLPAGFIPTEDQSMIYVNVTTPPGATVERTQQVMEAIGSVVKQLPEADNYTSLAGYSLVNEVAGASYGMGMINLKRWEEREHNVQALILRLDSLSEVIQDADIEYFPPPTVPGFGNASGFELRLLDKNRNGQLDQMAQTTQQFLEKLKKRPEIREAFTSFDPTFPQYLLHVDQDMAMKKGVTVDQAMETLQTLLGSYYATNFIRFGQMYKVMVQAAPQYRTKPEDILSLYVRNNVGEMVPFSTFLRLERVYGPEQLTRYNMYTSAFVTGDVNPGYSSGEALDAIREVADETLGKGFDYEWSGMTREQVLNGNQAIGIFLLCLLFVYLLLSAQYESFLLPFPVLLAMPAGLFGAFFLLKVTGLDNNIFAQVSFVMLIGLLAKNAILIVEFAIQREKEGLSALEAAKEGATSRLRPILMTSFAFIAGLIPLVVADGAGAMGNRSIGTAAAGGMLMGTIIGLLLVPGLYVIFSGLGKKKTKHSDIQHAVKGLVILVVLSGLSACKSGNNVDLKNTIPLPSQYQAKASVDTTQLMGDLSWKVFFKDSILISLIDSALTRNIDYKKANQRVLLAQAELLLARNARLPALQGYATGSIDRFGRYTMNGVGNFDTNLSPDITPNQRIPDPYTELFLGIRTQWEADLWGKFKKLKKASQARLLASEEGLKALKTRLVAEVAQRYYGLQALYYELEVVNKNRELQEQELEVVVSMKESGKATELAVQQFKAQLLNTQSLFYQVKTEIAEAERVFYQITGQFPGTINIPTQKPLEVPAIDIRAGIPLQLLSRRPDLRQAEAQLAAANADVEAARRFFYPSLTLNGNLAFNAFNPALLWNPASLAAGTLGGFMAPIFQQGRLKAQKRMAIVRAQESLLDYQQSLFVAVGEVNAGLKNELNLLEARQFKLKETNELIKAVSTSKELYMAGYANYLEIITAQKSVLEAELQWVNLHNRLMQNRVNLYRALGGGWK